MLGTLSYLNNDKWEVIPLTILLLKVFNMI